VIRALGALWFLLLIGDPLAAAPATSEASAGFDYCAPPYRPACVDDPRTYADGKAQKSCEDETSRYVSSVFKYRDCMYAQIERAIRGTNEAVSTMKCREAKQAQCP
jgi:hypothetical protein